MRDKAVDVAFCERIRVIIGIVGSMKELSRLSGVSAQVIRDYLTGKADPTRRKLINLANAVGVTLEWLTTGANPMMQGEEDKISAKLVYFIVEALEEHLESVKDKLSPQEKAAIISLSYQFSPRYDIDSENIKNSIKNVVLGFYDINKSVTYEIKSTNAPENAKYMMFERYLKGNEPMQGLASINKYLKEVAGKTHKEHERFMKKGEVKQTVDDIKRKAPKGDKKE